MSKIILFLHGWGVSGEKYGQLKKLFEKKGYVVLAPDLPGFGKEKMMKKAMDIDDYVVFVMNYLKKQKIKKVNIIAHSNGGRIAVKLTVAHPEIVETLTINGSPLMKRKLSFKKRLAEKIAKMYRTYFSFLPTFLEQFFRKALYYSIGEWDYFKAGQMKETFKKVVGEDLSKYLKKITVSTLVVWAENDTFVNIADGRDIASLIPHAKFVSVPQASHKLPYENPKIFADIICKDLL